jgi:hypothetical protein
MSSATPYRKVEQLKAIVMTPIKRKRIFKTPLNKSITLGGTPPPHEYSVKREANRRKAGSFS